MNNGVPISDRFLTHYYQTEWRGFHRLWNILSSQGIKHFLRATNKHGVSLLLSPTDYIDSLVLRHGYYESEVLDAIIPFLRHPGAVLWDIGANFGLHALTAKHLQPDAKVICFEPSPHLASRLYTNAMNNSLDIKLINIALADSRSYRPLYLADCNPGMTTLVPSGDLSYYKGKILCWCDTADNLIASNAIPPPTVVKLDVEGGEMNVLRGMKNTLTSATLEAIVFEANIKTDQEVMRTISDAGFRMKALHRKEATAHSKDNFVAVR